MRKFIHATLITLALGNGIQWAAAQGPLAPPGAPGATMRTLLEIEPRTPIASLPYTITQSGSYYVISNLWASSESGIVVAADDVTVDLNGFEISGTLTFGDKGIEVQGARKRLVVRNGAIYGFAYGFYSKGISDSRLEKLTIRQASVHGIEIYTMSGSCRGNTISDCEVIDSAYRGIYFLCNVNDISANVIENCRVLRNGGDGICLMGDQSKKCAANVVRDCVVLDNTGNGIVLGAIQVGGKCEGNKVQDCTIEGNTGNGIQLYGYNFGFCGGNIIERCTVCKSGAAGVVINGADHGQTRGNAIRDCTVDGSGTQGFFLKGDGSSGVNGVHGNVIERCLVTGSADAGLKMSVYCNHNVVAGNTFTDNAGGIFLGSGTGNRIADNTVLRNTTNYTLAAGNLLELLICELPVTLDQPCVARLAGTLTGVSSEHGITVSANNITVDLAGHSLVGLGTNSNAKYAIYGSGALTGFTVRNGTIRDWLQSGGGIADRGTGALFEDLHFVNCWLGIDQREHGLGSASGSLVSRCTATGCSVTAFYLGTRANVMDCNACANTNGFSVTTSCQFTRCVASGNLGYGFLAAYDGSFTDCSASYNGSDGFYVDSSYQIVNCVANYNGNHGINVNGYCTIQNNTCNENGRSQSAGAGVNAAGTRNVIDGNHVVHNDIGIRCSSVQNVVTRNSAAINSVNNYDVAAGNAVRVVTGPSGVAVTGSSGGSGYATTDPRDNLAY